MSKIVVSTKIDTDCWPSVVEALKIRSCFQEEADLTRFWYLNGRIFYEFALGSQEEVIEARKELMIKKLSGIIEFTVED